MASKSIKHFFQSLKERIETYESVSSFSEISRRYFVINGFDGAVTILGIILGTYMVGNTDPRIVIGSGLGSSLAMAISGFSGAYIAEKAERLRKMRELERSLFMDVNGTIIEKASDFASILIAAIDGLAPALTSFIGLFPFILCLKGIIQLKTATYISSLLIFILLFIMGSYIGKIARENVIKYGLLTFSAGLLVSLFSLLIGHI